MIVSGALHVFVDKMKALKAVMKLKGARFKAFARREDAENFAKGFCASQLKPSPEKTSAGQSSAHAHTQTCCLMCFQFTISSQFKMLFKMIV